MEIEYIPLFRGIDGSERKLILLKKSVEKEKEMEDNQNIENNNEKLSNERPIVFLCSGIHGDEINGIEIIHKTMEFLEKKLKRGTVYAMPMINPFGIEIGCRENPYDNEDINRNFPGDSNGSITERITNKIFEIIKKIKPDLVIDIHSDTLNSIPYAIIDRPLGSEKEEKETIEKSWEIAKKMGITVTYDIHISGYKKYRLDRTLTAAIINRLNIPSILMEIGGPFVIDKKAVSVGINCVKNVLSYLKMIKLEEKFVSETKINNNEKRLELLEEITANKSGIINYLVKPGQAVKKNEPLVEIKDIIGKIEEIIYAQEDCFVISLCDSSIAFPGSPLITIARFEKE